MSTNKHIRGRRGRVWGVVWAVLIGCCLQSAAEMRMWTMKDGRRFPGEFVRMQQKKLFVRTLDGRVQTVLLELLSPGDIRYIRLQTPPEISFSVGKNSDALELSDYCFDMEQAERITLRVRVEKNNNDPYDGVMHGKVYMLAQDKDSELYFVLHKQAFAPRFTEENDDEFEFYTSAVFRQWEEYNWTDRGYEYAGYIIIVYGPENRVLAKETNISALEDDAVDQILKYDIFTFFNESGRVKSVPRPEFSDLRREWTTY